MKKYLLLFLITCVIGFSSQNIQAATDLNAGDIVITTVHADSSFSTGACPNPTSTNNAFEFLNIVDITSGTVIYFTDNAITSTGSWRASEGTIVFTATNLIPAGSFTYYSDCVLVSEPMNWSKIGGRDPATAGDNLIAYQGVLGGTGVSVDFLYAIGFAGANTWITTGTPTSNNSYLPAGLTLGTTALALTPGTKRNAQYTCPATTNIYEPNFLTTVSDNTNWTGGAVGFSYLTLSGSCSVIPYFDLTITKTLLPITGNYFSSGYYHIGSPIGFFLQATVLGNTGYNVSLHDILPPYITFVSATATTGNYTNIDGLWQIGKMSSGSTESLIIYGTLQATGLGYNTGAITLYSGVDTNTGNNSAVIGYTGLQADNIVSLSGGSQSVISGSTVTYDISYAYSGTFINTGSIAFLFPTGFVLQSSTNPGYLPMSGGIIWSGISFAPNDSGIITLVGTIAGNSGAVFTGTTIIGDDTYCMSHYFLSGNFDGCLEMTTGNNISLTTGNIVQTVYDLLVTKTGSVTGYAGAIVPYTITVTNKGPHPATNITVTDIPGVGLIGAPYTTGIAQLLSGQSRVWNTSGAISNTIVSGQNITNTVLVTTADAGELYTGDNMTGYSFIGLSDKTDIGATITGVQNIWGGISSYTLIVTNYGPNTGYNLLLSLSKTGPMTLSHTGFVRSSIGIGETVQYTFTGFVSTGIATGTLYSIATIAGFSGIDLMTGNNSTSIAGNISNYAYGFGGGGGYEPAPTDSYTTGVLPVNPTTNISGDTFYNTTIEDGVCYSRKNLSLITDPYTSIVNKEFPTVLTMLYNYGLTKYTTVDTYRPEDSITRQEAAKMFSQFAMNVLCRKGQDITITYSDIDTVDSTLLPYIDLAYKLGLMHGDTAAGTFRPNDLITKQEFVTVLMRMLLASSLPEPDSDTWYSSYTNLAKNLSILSQNIDKTPVSISRHDAGLLFFRAYRNQDYTLYGIGYILENAQAMIDASK